LIGLALIGWALVGLPLPLIGVARIVSGANLRVNLLRLRISQRQSQRSY
jgi:hypothetical protein